MSSEFYRLVIYPVVRPPLLALRFIFGKLYSLLFGRLDIRTASKNQERLAHDVRANLSFLFSEHGARIVLNEGVRFPPPMDYAVVTLSIGNMFLRFVRGDGSLGVQVSPERMPQDWHELSQVLSLIRATGKSERVPYFYRLDDVAQVLRPNVAVLKDMLAEDRLAQTKKKLSEIDGYNHDVARQWEARINRRLYGP
jgi:hypothetical protein